MKGTCATHYLSNYCTYIMFNPKDNYVVEPHHYVQHQWLNFECKYPQLCVWNYICKTHVPKFFQCIFNCWYMTYFVCFQQSWKFCKDCWQSLKPKVMVWNIIDFNENLLQFINPMCWCHMVIKFCKNVLKLCINLFGMLYMVEVLDQMLLPFSWSIG
jgi:hypothetical protein